MRTLALALIALLPTSAAFAGDIVAGREKAKRCAVCHGIDGLAKQPHVPHIAGESDLYLRKQLEAFRSGEREDPQMTFMAAELSDEDIADIIEWYSSIKVSVVVPE